MAPCDVSCVRFSTSFPMIGVNSKATSAACESAWLPRPAGNGLAPAGSKRIPRHVSVRNVSCTSASRLFSAWASHSASSRRATQSSATSGSFRLVLTANTSRAAWSSPATSLGIAATIGLAEREPSERFGSRMNRINDQ